MRSVALHPIGNPRWPAGGILFDGLLAALREHGPSALRISILLPRWDGEATRIDPSFARLPYPSPARWTIPWLVDRSAWRLAGWEPGRRRQLREHRIDAVAFGPAPRPSGIPSIGWLPDFQHVRLPAMFSDDERRMRDREYAELAARSRRLIVLGESVRDDFLRFAPRHASKVRVVVPAPAALDTSRADEPAATARRYDLPERFFLLPGQFWAHKNHRAVVGAVARLAQQGVAVRVACTGDPHDYRHAAYLDGLVREIAERGLASEFVALGHVPYGDVIQLMRRAVAVIAPSRFEGFGLVVGEAAALGKRLLLTRIAAHVEQDPPAATYFDPDDHPALARAMGQVWAESAPGPDLDAERAAAASAAAKRIRYAASFLDVVEDALS